MIGQEAVLTFSPAESLSIVRDLAFAYPVNLGPSLTLARGTCLGLRVGAQNHVFTITVNSTVSGGTWTYSGYNPLAQATVTTAALDYNISNADLQTALEGVYGAGNVLVAGTALATGPVTVTLRADLAGFVAPTPTIDSSALTGGGNFSVAATTVGRSADTLEPISTLKLATPTAAPSVSGTGAAGGFAAGSYAVTYTLTTAEGETAQSPVGTIALTAGQSIRVAAISSLNARVTGVKYYVNGQYAKTTVPSSGTAAQTDIAQSELTGVAPPRFNGTGNFKAVLPMAVATDANGMIYPGGSTTPYLGQGGGYRTVSVEYSGVFRTSDLVGLDADALNSVYGRVLKGTVSSGVVKF